MTPTAAHLQKLIFLLALLLLLPWLSPVSAQFRDPGIISNPSLGSETTCATAAIRGETRPDGVDLNIWPPDFTKRTTPAGNEELEIGSSVINWGRTVSGPGKTVNWVRENIGSPGEPLTIGGNDLRSLNSCKSQRFTFRIAPPCRVGTAAYATCVRRYLEGFYAELTIFLCDERGCSLFATPAPGTGYSDANNANNTFRIRGSDLATRFGF